MENGFQGLDGQTMPEISHEFVQQLSHRYIELYEQLTGQTFVPADTSDIMNRIDKNVSAALEELLG